MDIKAWRLQKTSEGQWDMTGVYFCVTMFPAMLTRSTVPLQKNDHLEYKLEQKGPQMWGLIFKALSTTLLVLHLCHSTHRTWFNWEDEDAGIVSVVCHACWLDLHRTPVQQSPCLTPSKPLPWSWRNPYKAYNSYNTALCNLATQCLTVNILWCERNKQFLQAFSANIPVQKFQEKNLL